MSDKKKKGGIDLFITPVQQRQDRWGDVTGYLVARSDGALMAFFRDNQQWAPASLSESAGKFGMFVVPGAADAQKAFKQFWQCADALLSKQPVVYLEGKEGDISDFLGSLKPHLAMRRLPAGVEIPFLY